LNRASEQFEHPDRDWRQKHRLHPVPKRNDQFHGPPIGGFSYGANLSDAESRQLLDEAAELRSLLAQAIFVVRRTRILSPVAERANRNDISIALTMLLRKLAQEADLK
jgi:hypothetical protein